MHSPVRLGSTVCRAVAVSFVLIAFTCGVAHADVKGTGSTALADSLTRMAAGFYAAEPTVQQILDQLGYNISATSDELPVSSLCATPGPVTVRILAEYSGFADQARLLWYPLGKPKDTVEVLNGVASVGDSSVFQLNSTADLAWMYTPRSGTRWYTETVYNYDLRRHVRVFAAPAPNTYIVFWEDLAWLADGDFNDMVVLITMPPSGPSIDVAQASPDSFFTSGMTVCLDIDVTADNCQPETIALKMGEGYGSFTQQSSTTSFTTQHCFNPPSEGIYTFVFEVTTPSGATAEDTLDVVLTAPSSVKQPEIGISVTQDNRFTICRPGSLCVPFSVASICPLQTLRTSGGATINTVDSTLCIYASTDIEFCVPLVAVDECGNEDSVDVCFIITTSVPTNLNCPTTVDTVMCLPGFVVIPVSATGGAQPITISAVSPAVYNGGFVYLNVEESGDYDVYTIVDNATCPPETSHTLVSVQMNRPPTITGLPDTTITVCRNGQFCFGPIECVDPDNNLEACLIWDGPGTFTNGMWCYIPPRAEVVTVVFRAGDVCQRAAYDTLRVKFVNPVTPVITFNDANFDLCGPDEVCVPFSVSNPNGVPLSLSLDGPGTLNLLDSVVCVDMTQTMSVDLTLTAEGPCGGIGSKTATISGVLNEPPVVTCSPPANSFFCPGDPICFSYIVTDPGDAPASVRISGFGSEQNRQSPLDGENTVCFTAIDAGDFTVRIIATDDCGAADTCTTGITVVMNTPPTASVSDTTVFLCGPEEICIGVSCDDIDGNLTECLVNGSAGGFYDGGTLCFTPDTAGVYTVSVTAIDACGAQSSATGHVAVRYNKAPTVTVSGSLTRDAEPGDTVCFGFTTADPDNNVESVIALDDYLSYDNAQVCIEAKALSVVCARVVVTDACGLSDTVTVCVSAGPGPNPQPEPDLPDTFRALFCGPGDICVPFTIDPSFCPPQVLSGLNGGVIDVGPSVCLFVDAPGSYEVGVVASDTCGAGTSYVVIIAEPNQAPVITCPNPDTIFTCGDTSICRTLTYTDFEGNVGTASTSYGTVTNPASGQLTLCLTIDTAGVYATRVIVTDSCGAADTCTYQLTVPVNHPPELDLPDDQTVTICAGTQICLPIDCFDPDNNLITYDPIDVGDATWDGEDLCFTAEIAGAYQWVFLATDACGATDRDTLRVEVTLNTRPTISFAPDHLIQQCEADTFCIPYTVTDAENNIASVATTSGVVRDGMICIYTSQVYQCFDVTVTDSCGLFHKKTACVTRLAPAVPSIIAPDTIHYRLCSGNEFCFDVNVTPDTGGWDASVTPIGSFDADSQRVCFVADTAGVYVITTEVSNACGQSASATTVVFIERNAPPVLSGQTSVTVARCQEGPVCFTPLSVSDPDGNLMQVVIDSGNGAINAQTGEICFTPPADGNYCFRVRAEDSCGETAIARVCATVSTNTPPNVAIEDIDDIGYAPGPVQVCFDITASDANHGQTLSLQKIDGSGFFSGRQGKTTIIATHCFTADTSGCYRFIFESTDACGLTDRDTMTVCVHIDRPDSMFQICLDTVYSLNDRQATVKIRANQVMEMGGFDFLVCFDPTALTIMRAYPDTALQDWEYFTYRVGTAASCPPCVQGQVRVIGIIDQDNGPTLHPPEEAYLPRGPMIGLTFYVTPDRSFLGQCIPLDFCSFDCADNSISHRTGDTLYVANDGVPDTCVVGKARPVLRRIDYCEGRICIIPPPDDRGDMNLNGIKNEVGDAVFYTNFFIYGDEVFDPVYRENQILASDVNCDGMVLTVADLIYMIRIITGDQIDTDCPDVGVGGKVVPYAEAGRISLEQNEDQMEVWLETDSDVGGVFVRLNGNPQQRTGLEWGPQTVDLKRDVRQRGHDLRVLLTARQSGARLPGGRQLLFSFPANSAEGWQLVESQAATAEATGIQIEMVSKAGSVPSSFALLPNYPNPFNGSTQIRFSLGTAANWTLTVYNVLGQPVREFSGASEAGPVTVHWDAKAMNGKELASGVYFARLKADEFEDTRQMVLLK